MTGSLSRVADVLGTLPHDGALTEPEGLALLSALGVATPRHRTIACGAAFDPDWLRDLPGDRVVLKIVSRGIAHKSDEGGVLVLPRRGAGAAAGLEDLRRRFAGRIDGILLEEFVPCGREPGSELLLGFRWTDDFGPVVTVAAGGLHAEFLACLSGAGRGAALLSPGLEVPDLAAALRGACPAVVAATTALRGGAPRGDIDGLAAIVRRFLDMAARFGGAPLLDFEINPLVAAEDGRWVALDALGHVTRSPKPAAPVRPVEKVGRLLAPRSVTVIGVSEKMNPGRIIVRNLLREGFDPAAITIVKPNATAIDGCRCVPDVAAIEGPVDLCVLAIAAHQVPETVEAIVAGRKAESLLVIPGGLEEKEGSAPLVARLHRAIAAARAGDGGGPVICGGNSLGVRSLPGRIDTLFIPRDKLPLEGPVAPLALVSNSGAFAVARGSRLGLNPRYIVTAGNQMDLTIGDYVACLARDPEVRVFGVYVEGFRPLDGLRFAIAAREITESGRTVILYRAGRTAAGRAASASHTAAIAGDVAVTKALCDQAGVLVADTLEEFEDLVTLAVRLDGRPIAGRRLGAITNAGFECVAMADNLGPFTIAAFADATRAALRDLLVAANVGAIVDVHNPLDLTPMTPDAPYAEAARLVLADPNVDAAVVSCVPLTAALRTGAAELDDEDGIAARLIRLRTATAKPWVAVVDAGPLFDPLARKLAAGGLPVFRTADRALRALGRLAATRPVTRDPNSP